MIKCIAIDMDGTLLNASQQVTAENIAAIKKAQSQGVEVLIATGRSFQEASFVLANTELECPMICVNGAEVRAVNKEIMTVNVLEKSIVASVIEILHKNDVYFEVYTNKGSYTTDENKAISIIVDIFASANPDVDPQKIMKGAKERLTKGLVHKIEHYEELFHSKEEKIYKLLAFSLDKDSLKNAEEALLVMEGIAVAASGKSNLEITSVNAQKGLALEAYVKARGISLKETMAIGDNYNDLSMFKLAGRAVAMGNASDQIKAQCDIVTLTNEESGVAKAILYVLK